MRSMTLLLERPEEYDSGGEWPIPEKTLARLWQKRAARQREFRTSTGRRVRVLYAGRPGTAAGPDFRDALLEVEGLGLVQGDVELHLRQQDWYHHGHADDPNYNGVVLHGALETDNTAGARPTNLRSGHQAPVISLASLLEEGQSDTPAESGKKSEGETSGALWALLAARGWPRPGDADGMGQLLDAAGDARFQARAAVFAALNSEQPPSQTLYEGLMEGLGYRANRQPFLKLAQVAPWRPLAAEALACPVATRVDVIESRLLQLSGLAEPSGGGSSGPRRPSGYGRPLQVGEWHTFRVRPANHPRRRIAGAARLLARCLEMDSGDGELPEGRLVRALTAAVATGKVPALIRFLTVGSDEGKGAAPVGVGRARDLAVNVVLPFCHAWSGGDSTTDALALYRKFPKLQANEITREMAEQLMPTEWAGVVNSARRQQGLIHLHRQLSG